MRVGTKRGLASICLAMIAVLSMPGCGNNCPEGTVPCVITEWEFEVDTGSGRLQMRKQKYRTCVRPGECPDPGPASNAYVAALIGDITARMAAGEPIIRPDDVRVQVHSTRDDLGPLESATLVAHAGACAGADVRDTLHKEELVVVSFDDGTWTLRPRGAAGFDEFVHDTARLVTQCGEDTDVTYEMSLEFAHLPDDLRKGDVVPTVTVAGFPL